MSESKELAEHGGPGRDVATTNSGNMLAMVLAAARDPEVDAGKMEALANLAIKLQDREREAEFNRSKIAAIMEMPIIAKNGAITNKTGGIQSRYSKWDALHPIIMPILKRHGLVITHEIGHANQMVTVRPVLSHVNGFVEKGAEMALPIDTTGSKNGTQGAVSAASYGQRDSTVKMLNILCHGTDDDGQAAGGGSADPYGALTDWERELVDESRTRAMDGTAAYEDWFKALSTEKRGWLAYNKGSGGKSWHAANKECAAQVGA